MLSQTFKAINRNRLLYLAITLVLWLTFVAVNHGANPFVLLVSIPVVLGFQFILMGKLLDIEWTQRRHLLSFVVFLLKNLAFFVISFVTVVVVVNVAFLKIYPFHAAIIGIIAVSTFSLAWIALTAFLGSWMAAGVDGREASLKAAFLRGRRPFLRRFFHLLIVTALFTGVSLVPSLLINIQPKGPAWVDAADLVSLAMQMGLCAFYAVYMVDQYQEMGAQHRAEQLVEVF
ncbi:hypothetical protein [Oryzifoliimicrobium ureilyticus]|uniref:hypothetical protein n=1 Tax=Oryzifoliimicrobium ureilyticus TaxID=3113724 RepID=UPI00307662F3